jgi:apolipoprotein N-acyltransferase
MPGTANLRAVDDIHNSEQPQIVDARGDIITPAKQGLMVKIDAKAAETIELRKGTLWAIGILPVFLMLIFYYGSSILGFVRDDQTTKSSVKELQKDVDQLKQDAKDIKDSLKTIEIREAYKLGAGTSHENEQPKAKEK